MIFSMVVSILYKEYSTVRSFLYSASICFAIGLLLRNIIGRKVRESLHRKEGFLIVGLVWIIVPLAGSLPFMLDGVLPSFVNAFFESMSGFTSTGATVIKQLEETPKGILFWRSLSQWIGGGGLILFTITILKSLKEDRQHLYVAELTGPLKPKIHPKITETSRRFWYVYILMTIAAFLLLLPGDMTVFESICHAMGTVSTGGFSTRNEGLASFSNYSQYVVMIFMFLAGISFALLFFFLTGKLGKLWKDEQFRWYLRLSVLFIVAIFIGLKFHFKNDMEFAFRTAAFTVSSIISTTGYVIYRNVEFGIFIPITLFFLMLIGGCSGSTSGGIKISRILILFKYIFSQFKKQSHPQAVIPIKNNGIIMKQDVINTVFAFFFMYLLFIITGGLILSISGESIRDSLSMSASAMGNIGPLVNSLCVSCSYTDLTSVSKWVLSFLMLAGRLEIFALIALFSKSFWRY